MNNNVKMQHEELNDVMNNKMSNQLLNPLSNNQLFTKCSNKMNFLTQNIKKNNDGWDISGCRLDNNRTLQTTSMYGSPLAGCNTYNLSKMGNTGTLWYPLN